MRDLTRADLVVIGAGTAGAAAAAACAEKGLRVVCVDGRSLDRAGARWVNGVPRWMFERAGLVPPTSPELRPAHGAFHLVAGWGPTRLTIGRRDVLDVDMRHLTARLQRLAAERGADLRGDCRVVGYDGDAVHTDRGRVPCRWVVDASGLKTAGLVPAEAIPPADLCTASQEVRELVDEDAARDWLAGHGAAMGDTVCFSGIAGGYSILNVSASPTGGVSLLTGAMASKQWPSGARLLRDFVASQPWVGPRVFGGAGPIPVGGPRRRLVWGNVALLGDAGGQVYAAHGSGIGAQLLAARELADALSSGRGLEGYQRSWWDRWAPELVASASFARFSRTLRPSELERLLSAGLLTEALVVPALEQRRPAVSAPEVARLALRAVRAGRLGVRVARAVAATEVARVVARRH